MPDSPVLGVGDRPLRINWINPRPNLSGGVKSNRLIAEAMVRRGHDVRIVFVDRGRPWPRPWEGRALVRRVVNELKTLGKERHHLACSTAALIPVRHAPIRATDVPDADVSIATWWETMEWIRDWPPSKGVHAYFIRHHELHGGDPDRVRATYRQPGIKLVIATWLKRLMAEVYEDPSAVLVPNGVDWSQFDTPPRPRPAVPTVGLLYGVPEWKGAGAAFEALGIVRGIIPSLHVLVFGREAMDRRHRPPPRTEFHLRPSQALIPELYRRATCWVVPSTSEGFGMPGLEAAACRCPIVATRCGGPEDYVRDGASGFLVPVGDVPAMASAIERVMTLNDANWRVMSEASHREARRFSWDRSAEILERTLHRALGRVGETEPDAGVTVASNHSGYVARRNG